jgi:BASS family bile acid:Na+ symporter
MIDILIGILAIATPLSVVFIMLAQGLKISPDQVTVYFREHPLLLLRSLLSVLVLVPLAALAIILLFKPPIEVAVGLAILVSCPPAPLMLNLTPKVGKGSAAYMASLHLSLAVLAFFTVPLILYLISVPLGFQAEVHLLDMAIILARTILLPILLGMAILYYFPKFADTIAPWLEKVGGIMLSIVVLLIFIQAFPSLLNMGAYSYLVIFMVSAVGLAIGHFLGSNDPAERTTLAVESGVRHPALALMIATSNYTPERALPIMLPCILVFILAAVGYMLWRRKSAAKS